VTIAWWGERPREPKSVEFVPKLARQESRPTVVPRLRFLPHRLFSLHADLRVSLRKVRTRQRNPRPLQRLEGNGVPALRLKKVVQEIFHVRLRQLRRQRFAVGKQRRWRLLRRALPRRTLNPSPDRSSRRESAHSMQYLSGLTSAATPVRRLPAPSRASDLPPPNRAGAVLIRPASRRRWPRPALSRR